MCPFNDLGQWIIEDLAKSGVELRDKPTYLPKDGERYHIHQDGQRVTDQSIPMKFIVKRWGPVEQLESKGLRLVHDPAPTSKIVQKSMDDLVEEKLEKGLKTKLAGAAIGAASMMATPAKGDIGHLKNFLNNMNGLQLGDHTVQVEHTDLSKPEFKGSPVGSGSFKIKVGNYEIPGNYDGAGSMAVKYHMGRPIHSQTGVSADADGNYDMDGIHASQLFDHLSNSKEKSSIGGQLMRERAPGDKTGLNISNFGIKPEVKKSGDLEKSNYGIKGVSYNPTDNIRRKANRTSEEIEDVGPNKAAHQYTSATMGTAKQQAVAESKKVKELSGPVRSFKDMTPEEQEKLKAQYETKKGEDMDKDVEKIEPLSKPPVSEAQRKAMYAAAAGKSTLDIPENVAQEYVSSDSGNKLPDRVKKEELSFASNGQWNIEKVEDGQMGRGGKPKDISMFSGEHMNHVVSLPHHEAKKYAHDVVEASSAKPENKAKAKAMIDKSKNSKHIAMGMANFALSSEGLGSKLKD